MTLVLIGIAWVTLTLSQGVVLRQFPLVWLSSSPLCKTLLVPRLPHTEHQATIGNSYSQIV